MLIHTLAACTFLLFSSPVVIAIANNITQITSSLTTAASCIPSPGNDQMQLLGLSVVDGNLQCACRPYSDLIGWEFCAGDYPACSTVVTTYIDGSSVSNASCGTCYTADFGSTCYNILNVDTIYDTSCSSGEVLFTSSGQSCGGCDYPESIAANPGAVACSNVPPENSYAACISSQVLPANANNGGPAVYDAQCSFACIPGYDLSSDGNSCILITIPVVPISDYITNIYTELYTAQYCNDYFVAANLVPGIFLANSESGDLYCGCIEVDSGTENCASACFQNNTDYLGQQYTLSATCTTCDPPGCENLVLSSAYYDSGCQSGSFVFIAEPDTINQYCGSCSTAEFIAETGGTVCAPVENGFAICNSIELVGSTVASGHEVATCSFVCVNGYQISTDGTSCVLSSTINPSGLPAAARRKKREMARRRKLEMLF